MPGPYFHVGAVAMCPHGGQVTTVSANARVLVSGMPVALMTGSHDISLELWLRSKKIPIFRKPLDLRELKDWVDGIRISA